ncbi:MAG: hypothetical protein ACRCSK_03365 [Fusobacteriaceae bacterium]
MITRNFLIVVEGSGDILPIKNFFIQNFSQVLNLKLENNHEDKRKLFGEKIELISNRKTKHEAGKNLSTFKITLPVYPSSKDKQEIKIYIQNSKNNALKDFIDKELDDDLRKIYNIDDIIFKTYTLFDMDSGSNKTTKIKQYFNSGKDSNIYTVLNYPAFESHHFQKDHSKIFSMKDEICEEHEDFFTIEEHSIFLNKNKEVTMSTEVKNCCKKFYFNKNTLNSGEEFRNSKLYLKNNLGEQNSFDYLENQLNLYENKIVKNKKILLTSFLSVILENIIDSIIMED